MPLQIILNCVFCKVSAIPRLSDMSGIQEATLEEDVNVRHRNNVTCI
jgi:hypothetical protein